MATTTNYGWTTPNDTDLVKDGAAAIRTLGSSVDTTTKNLNPETTLGDMSFRSATSNVNTRLPIGSSGQHLTVVAGVPAWATASDQTPLTTKGDLFTFSTVDARLGVGNNDYRIVAASGEATGLKYVADTQNTVIDAEGDLLVGDSADTIQRLALGSNAQVLTIDTTVDGKIKWATPAAGSTFAGASVTKDGTAQSLSNATYTAIVYQTEDYDTDTFHSTSSNTSRFTIPSGKDGKYLFTVVVNFATDNAGDRRLAIYKNGSAVLYAVGITSTNNSDTRIGASVIYNLVATDYIEIFAFQNSGTSINLRGGAIENQFTITYLGA
jgi:hypothetical protein